MAIILGGLMTKVVSPNFPWLYPIIIGLAVFSFYIFRKLFFLIFIKPSILSAVVGVAVFAFWIYLIPENPTQSAHFLQNLNEAPLPLELLWLLCRVLGAVIIIPIAEEFAFRGYFQPRLQLWLEQRGLDQMSAALSLLIVACAFGLLHANFLAAFMAGTMYGLAFLQQRRLMDAVVAHVVTNGLLCIYVLTFGYWSYWF